MDTGLWFHKRPLAGAALGVLVSIILSGALPSRAMLLLAAGTFLGGCALLYFQKPFAAMLCAFALFSIRIVLLPGATISSDSGIVTLVRSSRDACETALDALFGVNGGSAKGILLGDTADLSPETLDLYRRSGLAHILAVSGLHITILCTALQYLLRGFRAWISLLLTCLFLLFYGALTGFSPSFCRAALMFVLALTARAAARRYDSLSALCFAFTVVLFVSPAAFYSVSFQLSFSCMYGMLMLTRPLSRLMRLPKRVGFFSPATAFAVQIGILPVAATYFRSISNVGVLLSIVVVPLMPLFIVPAFLAMVLYFLFPGAAAVVAFLPNVVLKALNAVCAWTDALPVAVSAPPVTVTALYLISLLLLSPYFLPNRKRPPYAGLAVAVCSVLLWILL